MREPPNWLLRIFVPLLLVGAGVGVLFAVMQNTKTAGQGSSGRLTTPAQDGSSAAQTPQAPETASDVKPQEQAKASGENKPADTTSPEKPAVTTEPPTPAPGEAGKARFTVRKHPLGTYAPVGSDVPAKAGGTYEMEIRFASFGAGIERLSLANHTEKILSPDREVLQSFTRELNPAIDDPRLGLAAFSAVGVTIDGTDVGLGVDPGDRNSTYWEQTAPGEFVATIADADDRDVLRVSRKFIVRPGSYEFTVEQKLLNLTNRPLAVVWHQIGPIDQPPETVRYGGDPRAIRFGYMASPSRDPSQMTLADPGTAGLIRHSDALGSPGPNGLYPARTLWPNKAGEKEQLTLVWAGTTSRYFTVAVFPTQKVPSAPATGASLPATPAERTLEVKEIDRVGITTPEPPTGGRPPFGATGLRLVSPTINISAGGSADVSVSAYAGPTSQKYINAQPQASRVGLASVVVYTWGGPCGFCTFQTVTQALQGLLGLLHDYVLRDWGLAVMALVVCVRTLLHPVTKWSQIRLLRSSNLMKKLAPKQKAIQEKYANDPETMRKEIGRLMQEEGMGATAGMAMGCVPGFLQMPVWIALSATLYFLFDLRHQAAFFGVFQSLSGGKWSFFADLAEPDHFLRLGREIHIPLLSGLMGAIDGLNVMPLLMGVVFFIQQKYLQPPQTAPMTPEQEQQMKIMKVVTVVMFPLMMYNAPSGLALYFFTNSSLAILETRHIRSRAERLGLDQPPPKRKRGEAGEPGILARLSQMAEERQKMMEEARKLQAKRDKGNK